MTATPMPTDLSFGKVVGRFLIAVSDSSDPDRMPDARPASGQITFTPIDPWAKGYTPTPTTVFNVAHNTQIDQEGWIIDEPGGDGIWLPVGFWRVSYKLDDLNVPSHVIEVLASNTDSDPVDLIDNQILGGPILKPSEYAELNARISKIEIDGIVSHADTHKTGGSDQITPASIGALSTADFIIKSFISGTADLDTITSDGDYPANATIANWTAQHYPANARGHLTVRKAGPWVFQTYRTLETTPRLFIRYHNGSAWSSWRDVGDTSAVNIIKSTISGTTDLNTVTADGDYPANSSIIDWQAQHYPINVRGYLTVRKANVWYFQMYRTAELTPRMFVRTYVGSWGAWRDVTAPTVVSTGVGSIRHDMLVDDLLSLHGGPVGTSGAVPVALTFDDYPRQFRDYMRAPLTSRGLTYTLALSSGMYDSAAVGTGGTWEAVYNGATGTTWAEIAGWLDADGAEVANHSRRHQGGSGLTYLTAEIRDGLTELETVLGRKVWSWVQPSATYVDDNGHAFANGNNIDAYAINQAGKLIWDNHAMMTGVRSINGKVRVPRRGRPAQGIDRMWISSAGGISGVQAAITAGLPNGEGIVVGSHGRDIQDGLITQAQFNGFLDWLVTEQTAGRVKVMTLSRWAVADTTRSSA